MALDFANIRAGLATRVDTISGIRSNAYIKGNIVPPCAEVEPGPIDYDAAMARGGDDIVFTVRVMVGEPTDIGAQKKLDAYMAGSGSSSVKAAIEGDRTLAGAAGDVRVRRNSGYRLYERGGSPVLGAEWEVLVLA